MSLEERQECPRLSSALSISLLYVRHAGILLQGSNPRIEGGKLGVVGIVKRLEACGIMLFQEMIHGDVQHRSFLVVLRRSLVGPVDRLKRRSWACSAVTASSSKAGTAAIIPWQCACSASLWAYVSPALSVLARLSAPMLGPSYPALAAERPSVLSPWRIPGSYSSFGWHRAKIPCCG